MSLRVTAFLGMDGSGFFNTLGRAGFAVNRFASSVAMQFAGVFSVGALGMAARSIVNYADNIDELSQRAGISAKALQEWGFAAKQSGSDAEKLVKFIEKLSSSAGDLKNLKAFKALGIDPTGMTPGALFGAFSSKTSKMSSTDIMKAVESVGMDMKTARQVINVLQMDLAKASEEANKFGAVMDDVTIKQLATLGDKFSILSQVLMGQFAPSLIAATEGILNGVQNFLAFIDRKVGNKSVTAGGMGGTGAGNKALGVASGILGLWDEIGAKLGVPGAQELSDKRFDYANKVFSEEGWNGVIDSMADALNDTAKSGSLSEKFAKFRETLAAAAANVTPQSTIIPTLDKPKTGKAATSDALVTVGNFLGSGSQLTSLTNQILNVNREHLAVSKEIRRNLTSTPGVSTVEW